MTCVTRRPVTASQLRPPPRDPERGRSGGPGPRRPGARRARPRMGRREAAAPADHVSSPAGPQDRGRARLAPALRM